MPCLKPVTVYVQVYLNNSTYWNSMRCKDGQLTEPTLKLMSAILRELFMFMPVNKTVSVFKVGFTTLC